MHNVQQFHSTNHRRFGSCTVENLAGLDGWNSFAGVDASNSEVRSVCVENTVKRDAKAPAECAHAPFAFAVGDNSRSYWYHFVHETGCPLAVDEDAMLGSLTALP